MLILKMKMKIKNESEKRYIELKSLRYLYLLSVMSPVLFLIYQCPGIGVHERSRKHQTF